MLTGIILMSTKKCFSIDYYIYILVTALIFVNWPITAMVIRLSSMSLHALIFVYWSITAMVIRLSSMSLL